MNAASIAAYWYYHLPNFILAALMYTLLGRALLGLIVGPDSNNYIWRFFCRITDPLVAAVTLVTPNVAPPVIVWLFGVVWLFWLRVGLLYVFLLLGAVPPQQTSDISDLCNLNVPTSVRPETGCGGAP